MIRLSKSSISQLEIDNVSRVLKAEYLGMGEEVKIFEDELSSHIGNNAVCVNSGTAALQLAFQAIGLKPGDEVLCPTITFLGTYQAVTATGATPVPCEIQEKDILISLDDAEKRLTKNTKAICLVHYAGNPGDLEKYYEFAHKNNLRVIEDAAHAFGTTYNGKLIGSFGDIICFSFDGIKNITAGEGGAIFTSDPAIISKIKDLRLLGIVGDSERRYRKERSWTFDVHEQGWRYHMSDVMAAIGRMQLKRLPEFSTKRQLLSKKYLEMIETYDLPVKPILMDYNTVTPHIFVVKVEKGERNKLQEHLSNNKIQTGIHYYPNNRISFLNPNNKFENYPVTDDVYDKLLTLPLHFDLTNEDIEHIAKTINNFYI